MRIRHWTIIGFSLGLAGLLLLMLYGSRSWQRILTAPLLENQPAFPLREIWSNLYGSGGVDLVSLNDAGSVLVRTRDALFAVDSSSGDILWTTPIGSHAALYPATAKAGRLYATDDQSLFAFDQVTGVLLWDRPLQSVDTWVSSASDDIVLVNTLADSLAAFDARSGTEIWSVPVGRGYIESFVADNIVYVVDHGIQALESETGRALWKADSAPTGSSAFLDGVIYFVTYPSDQSLQIVAIDLDSHQVLWRTNTTGGGNERLAISGAVLFLADNTSLSALKRDNGQTMWRRALNAPRHPTTIDGHVYVLEDFDGILQALDIENGTLAGGLQVFTPKFFYVYHENLISVGRYIILADGNRVTAYRQ